MSNRRVGVWRWSVVCALSIMCSLGLATSAVADDAQTVLPPRYYEDVAGHGELPNMFETNVPYVAWRGEQIRAVKCDWDYKGVKEADVIVGDWSGDGDFKPELESTQFEAFNSSRGKPCVAFNMLAHRPGMAFVVLTPKDPNPDDYYVPAKHTFLMIWMSIKDVSIDEVGENDPTGQQPEGSNAELGDPAGDGIFDAGDPYGRVAVKVSGTFPAFDGGAAWTLPNDWSTLAMYATDNRLGNTKDPMRWDIHDDQTAVKGHQWGFCSPPFFDPPAPHTDAVDNCNGGDDLGHFSTVFGTGNLAAGPFDPARPATLLSNGQLNSGDAPMPALRVNVKIKPNSGADGDLSGVGQLVKSDKSDVYSRDGSGADVKKWNDHNLYAPYYKQFIPATYPIKYGIPEASGIDGPCQINDNVGFAWPCGKYDNWDTYATGWAHDGPTQCNKYVDWEWSVGSGGYPNGESFSGGGGGGHYDRPNDTPRRNPYGPQNIWVYTDEHGEAQVRYDPYAGGFFYDGLIGDGPGKAILNDNRGCDLQDVDLLGTSEISASADYPYLQVGPNVPVAASPASITKQVFNEFDKSMYYYPKGTGAANQNARIVVVHANDVNGEPFAGEKVCFYLDDEADGVRGFAGVTGVANGEPEMSMEELGRRPHHGKPLPEGRFRVEGGYAHKVAGDICRTLDRNGNAAIEVFNSDPQDINVIAEFLEEGLLRDIDVDFRVAGSSSGGQPPQGNDDNSDCRRSHNGCPRSNDGTTPPSAAQIVATAGPQAAAKLAPSIKKAKAKARRITVRRVTLRKGKYALTIRVNSPRKSETVRIRVGKRSIKRRVATNRLVTLKGLPISKGVNVSVSLSS